MSAPVAMAVVGHNNPPEPTPFEACRDEIEGLYMEAKNHLDGEPVREQAQADSIGKLMADLRAASKRADAAREAENKPFDDGKAEVQARYAPLISDTKSVRGKAVLALDACNKALAPFLAAQDAEKRRAEAEAREAARAAAEAAQAAFRASQVDDLQAREEAERLATIAKAAETTARKAENDRATVKGGARAIGMRKTYTAKVVDTKVFARWVWANRQHELSGMLQTLSERLCADGLRDLPGVHITEGVRAQ